MDIFVNNAPAPAAPTYQAQTFPGYAQPPAYGYTQGYPAPAPYGYGYGPRDHGGPGFGFILLLLLGAFLFFRFRMAQGWRRGRKWRRMMAAQGGAQDGQDQPGDAPNWRGPRFPWARDNAAEIARERFAKGEIDAEQLTAILKGLDAE